MLEGVHVVLDVLVVVVGVDEVVVLVAEDVGRGDVAAREEDLGWVLHLEDLLGVVVEQASLLVAEIDADALVAFDADGVVDAYGAVVGGDG